MPSDFTPNNVWGTTSAGPQQEELTLPSGQNCLAQKVNLADMLAAGILSEVDSLTALVQRYTKKVKAGSKAQAEPEIDSSILGDKKAVEAIFRLADKAMPFIVVSPPVACHFKEVTVGKTTVTKTLTDVERAELTSKTVGLIFTDQIGVDDKFQLFNWGVGGLDALASFRQESSSNVGDVAPSTGPKGKGKRRSSGK